MSTDLQQQLRAAMHEQVGRTFAPAGVLEGVLRRHRRHRQRVLLSSAVAVVAVVAVAVAPAFLRGTLGSSRPHPASSPSPTPSPTPTPSTEPAGVKSLEEVLPKGTIRIFSAQLPGGLERQTYFVGTPLVGIATDAAGTHIVIYLDPTTGQATRLRQPTDPATWLTSAAIDDDHIVWIESTDCCNGAVSWEMYSFDRATSNVMRLAYYDNGRGLPAGGAPAARWLTLHDGTLMWQQGDGATLKVGHGPQIATMPVTGGTPTVLLENVAITVIDGSTVYGQQERRTDQGIERGRALKVEVTTGVVEQAPAPAWFVPGATLSSSKLVVTPTVLGVDLGQLLQLAGREPVSLPGSEPWAVAIEDHHLTWLGHDGVVRAVPLTALDSLR